MSSKSNIEWTDATWNPVTGCTKVSQGCKNCYAERDWARLSANPTAKAYYGRPFTEVRCHPDRLRQPLHWKRPRRIFVNSMSDLFHDAVPDDYIAEVFSVMALCPQHIFQILTKRPARMHRLLNAVRRPGLPEKVAGALARLSERGEITGSQYLNACALPATELPNVWLGVSVEFQAEANSRIPLLLNTPAAVRFLSCEPLLGKIDLEPSGALDGHYIGALIDFESGIDELELVPRIDWVIAGGESGPSARPMHPDWVREVRDQCNDAGVPFFFKQWGEWAPVCAQYPGTDAEHDEAEEASLCGDICLRDDGYIWEDGFQPSIQGRPWLMARVGKKNAGRILDGRPHDEYPVPPCK